jgi:hypothetical protein
MTKLQTGSPPRNDSPPFPSSERRTAGISCRTPEHAPARARIILLLEHFFDLSEFFLNFAGGVFGFAFGL